MALDKLLKENLARLEQIRKQPLLDKVDPAALAMAETQRKQRIADLEERIAALKLRGENAAAALDAAIAADEAELNSLTSAGPSTPPVRAVPTKRAAAKPKRKSR